MWAMMPWFRIVPYGEFWLRLPTIIIALASVVAVSRLARRIGGRDLGFFTFVLMITCGHIWTDTAWDARPYSLWVLLSALTTFAFISRLRKETTAAKIWYGVLLALSFYTHMLAILTIAFFALTDLGLCIMKKVRFRCVISYIIAFALCVPAAVFTLKYSTIDMSSFWPEIPGNPITAVAGVANTFLGNPMSGLLFLLSTLGVVIAFLIDCKKQQKDDFDILFFFVLSGIWVLGITYVYSQFINPNFSLWVKRYFDGVWPQAIILTAFGGIIAVNFAIKHLKFTKQIAIVVMSLFLFVNGGFNIYVAVKNQLSVREPYRQVAEKIADDTNAYSEQSVILVDTDPEPWLEYYFELRGLPVPSNVVTMRTVETTKYNRLDESSFIGFEDLLDYKRVYVCNIHNKIAEEVIPLLSERYEIESEYDVVHIGLRTILFGQEPVKSTRMTVFRSWD
jgi:hypothetical protein